MDEEKHFYYIVVWDSESNRWHVSGHAPELLGQRIIYDPEAENWDAQPDDKCMDEYVVREEVLQAILIDYNGLLEDIDSDFIA